MNSANSDPILTLFPGRDVDFMVAVQFDVRDACAGSSGASCPMANPQGRLCSSDQALRAESRKRAAPKCNEREADPLPPIFLDFQKQL